jgi:hypothetical protein
MPPATVSARCLSVKAVWEVMLKVPIKGRKKRHRAWGRIKLYSNLV